MIALCALPVQLGAQVQITVPEDHWSMKAMEHFAEKGLAPGYRPDDFRGINEYTREDLAHAVAAVIAHYITNRNIFSLEDIQLLGRLRDEYEPELGRLGGTNFPQAVSPAAQSAIVPAGHWAYSTLAAFAARGLVAGYSESDFRGGRLFTRADMAKAASGLIASKRQHPDIFSKEDLRKISYIEVEFAKELAALEKAAPYVLSGRNVPYPSTANIFSAWGSSNVYASVKKSEKSNITNRLTYETKGKFLKTYFSGSIDNSYRSGADMDFGGGYSFELTKKLLELHSSMSTPETDAYALLGDVDNITFANGLTVGSAGVKGTFLSAPFGKRSRAVAAWGEDSGGDELWTLRIEKWAVPKFKWGIVYVNETNDAGDAIEAVGTDIVKKMTWGSLTCEYSDIIDSGSGLYIAAQRAGVDDVTLDMEYRYYRDFTLDHNNPPKYSGRSGSNGVDEKSIYGRIAWKNGRRWVHTISRDHVYNPLSGRKTNYYIGNEFRLNRAWTMAYGQEKEQGGGTGETEKSYRARWSPGGSQSVSLTWKRAADAGGPSSTSRIDYSRRLFGNAGKFLYSFSRRKSRGTRTNSSRFRLSNRINDSLTTTLSYDYSRNRAGSFDINIIWKF